LCFLSSAIAEAGEAGYAYCPNGEQYQHLYQSLSTFNVLAKLKCGEKLEDLGRENILGTYVRVRTMDGKEGYVPQSAITSTPPTTNQNSAGAKSSGQEQPHVPASMDAANQGAPPPEQSQPASLPAPAQTRPTLVPSQPTSARTAPTAPARKKHAPLPDLVLQAKTIYIVNLAGNAAFRDRAYDELTKWGRYEVVSKRENADLIFVLSAGEYTTAMVTNSDTTGRVDELGNVNLQGHSQTSTVVHGSTFLTVVDPKNGDELWSDSKAWGSLWNGFHSATRGLINNLRKRIAEQEK
jgi:uncharacterized protein YgiM (DUF1202 family)